MSGQSSAAAASFMQSRVEESHGRGDLLVAELLGPVNKHPALEEPAIIRPSLAGARW